jgi:hypothetical protein
LEASQKEVVAMLGKRAEVAATMAAVYAAQNTKCVAEEKLADWKKVKFRKRIIGEIEDPVLNGAEGKSEHRAKKRHQERAREWKKRRAANAPDAAICNMRGQDAAATEVDSDEGKRVANGVKKVKMEEENPNPSPADSNKPSRNSDITPKTSGENEPTKPSAKTSQADLAQPSNDTSKAQWAQPSFDTSQAHLAKPSTCRNNFNNTSQEPKDKPSLEKAEKQQAMAEDDWECSTVTTAEETEGASSDSDSDWEDIEEEEIKGATKAAPLFAGLNPPRLESGDRINGLNKRQLRRENKKRRQQKQMEQAEQTYWSIYRGEFELSEAKEELKSWRNMMCPRGLALHHPAAAKLLEYATGGCPANTGKNWSKEQIWAAVERGPHVSALNPDSIKQLKTEIADKVKVGQCRVVLWDDIKDDPPPQLKISPL